MPKAPWMLKLTFAIIVIVVLLLGGGIAYLALWDIPAPTQPVEKVIPDERLPR
jgi:hypothetical protein